MSFNTWLSLSPNKLAVVQKEYISRIYSHLNPVYLVNEHPKSGGTWLKFMLADVHGLPAWTKGAPSWRSCVMQAHWLAPHGKCRTVALFRDGRDVMVSYYFHSFFRNEFQNASFSRFMRNKFNFADYEDLQSNLLPFMKVMLINPVSPGFTWMDFVRVWNKRPGTVSCRYEDLRRDTAQELIRLGDKLLGLDIDRKHAEIIADRYSMENMRKRKSELNPIIKNKQIAEKSFIRKGSVGGWSEHFSDEALEWFESQAGEELIALGYKLGRPVLDEKT